MFVTIHTYRAKVGEEDAIIALHEDQARNRALSAKGYLSGELFRDLYDPQVFIYIARFESEMSAQLAAQNPEQISWQRRLASLTEVAPTITNCERVWLMSNEKSG